MCPGSGVLADEPPFPRLRFLYSRSSCFFDQVNEWSFELQACSALRMLVLVDVLVVVIASVLVADDVDVVFRFSLSGVGPLPARL